MKPFLPGSRFPARLDGLASRLAGAAFWFLIGGLSAAEATNSVPLPWPSPSLPDAGVSLFRVFGALALVLGIFLGGVWLFRNWQRLALQRGEVPKLDVVEVRSLGGKHALYVVGYQQERFLLSASPTGVNLLTHLPPAEAKDQTANAQTAAPTLSFTQSLRLALRGK